MSVAFSRDRFRPTASTPPPCYSDFSSPPTPPAATVPYYLAHRVPVQCSRGPELLLPRILLPKPKNHLKTALAPQNAPRESAPWRTNSLGMLSPRICPASSTCACADFLKQCRHCQQRQGTPAPRPLAAPPSPGTDNEKILTHADDDGCGQCKPKVRPLSRGDTAGEVVLTGIEMPSRVQEVLPCGPVRQALRTFRLFCHLMMPSS
jgi:hypothetical protein